MLVRAALLIFVVTSLARGEHAAPPTPSAVRPAAAPDRKSACRAIEKSLDRIQSSVAHVTKERDCFNCHHNTMTLETFAAAKKNGLVDDAAITSFNKANLAVLKRDLPPERLRDHIRFLKLDRLNGPGVDLFAEAKKSSDPELNSLDKKTFEGLEDIHGSASTVASALTALRAANEPGDERSREMARYLTETQATDGHWEPSEKRRVPSEGSAFQLTASSVNALARYGELDKSARNRAAFDAGLKWLLSPPAAAADTQDHATYLSGLVDLRDAGAVPAGAKAKLDAIVTREKAELLKQQRPDGGWRQLASRPSDAYATGLVLSALAKAGVDTSGAAYAKGADFLLGKQERNGDWLVASRVDAQFETLFLIDDPAPGGVTADDVAAARPLQKKHRDVDDEHRGGLNELRDDPKRGAEVDAHHRVHSQFISFMATNLATQALSPVCAAEKRR